MMMVWCTDGDNYLTAESRGEKMVVKLNVQDLLKNEINLNKEDVEELLKLCEIHLNKL